MIIGLLKGAMQEEDNKMAVLASQEENINTVHLKCYVPRKCLWKINLVLGGKKS